MTGRDTRTDTAIYAEVMAKLKACREVFESEGYGVVRETTVHDDLDDRDVPAWAFATGGWSENERAMDEMMQDFFVMHFWERSERGGLHVFRLPIEETNGD